MFQLAVVALTALANTIIALAVYKRNPRSATHLLLASLSLITALWTVFNFLALQPGSEATRLFWVKVVMFVTTPYGTVIYLLAETFPGAILNIRKRKKWFLIIFNIITAAFAISPYMFTQVKNLPGGSFELVPGPAIILFAIAFVGFMTAGFVRLISKFRHSRGLLRQQLLLFLLGLIISFTLLTLTNFIAVVVFRTLQLTALGPPFTLILFGMMVYAILRHRFLDINYLVARAVSYTLLLTSFVGVYVAVLFAATRIVPDSVNSTVLSVVITLVVALSFNPLRSLVEAISDRFFFQRRYDTEELLNKLTQIMATEINVQTMAEKLVTEVAGQLRLTTAACVIFDGKSIVGVETIGFKDHKKLEINELKKLVLQQENQHIIFEEVNDESKKKVLRQSGIQAVFALNVKQKNVGLFIIGPKASGEILTDHDIDFLTIFAPQAAIALQNAQSYRRIQQFSRTLEKKVAERTEELKETQLRSLRKAKELLHLKDEFVFIATHDLGTPVTAIQGYTHLLDAGKEKFSKDTKENIAALSEASERLKQLTDDLLQVARSDSGVIKISPTEINLYDSITAAITQLQPQAASRSVKFVFKPISKKVMVLADVEKVAEVMENLLSNAVKYNKEKGTVTVTLSKKAGKAEVSVTDTGIGIPAAKQRQVFQKFFRAQQNGAESVPGTGLGLFLVKVLLKKMEGDITFTSVENQGSTFTFTLPLVRGSKT